MNNVEMSPLGRAIAQNGPLSYHIMDRLSSLTPEEKRRGYFEVPLKDGKKLILTFGPDRRPKAARS